MINKRISSSVLSIGCKFIPPKGGIAQVMYNYKEFIFEDFKFICNSGDGCKIYKIYKFIAGLFQLIYYLFSDRKIKIVHIHTASYNSFYRSSYYIKVAKFFNKKVILHIHGGGFKEFHKTNPKKISSILNLCDRIITLSKSWKTFFERITNNIQIDIVENLVSPPNLEKCKINNKVHLLFLGLICNDKGIFDLIEVIHQNENFLKNKMILHIGGNGDIKKLETLINKYQLNDWVIYEGWVSGDNKNKLLQKSDIFILPSYIEGLPMSIIEAMTYGKPIISTNVGGIPELIENGINGILFNPGDKLMMKHAITELIDNANKRINMGKESLKKSLPYLPDQVESKLNNIYLSLLYNL